MKQSSRPSPLTIGICAAGMILAVLGIYFGALLPLLKAQAFIGAERQVAFVQTVGDFEKNYDRVFDFYSPVGDEEVAKFLGGEVLNIIGQGQPEEVSRELVSYMEQHLFKDDVRHLLILGQMRETLWQTYGKEDDFQRAVAYFEKAHEIGPTLPPPLYFLFDLYQLHKDKGNLQRIGGIILANWPQDSVTRAALASSTAAR